VAKLSGGLTFRKAHDALDNIDQLNTPIVLPDATDKHTYIHNPKGRGLDLKYNPTICTLIVTVRSSSISASNPILCDDLDELQIGDNLGNDTFHCRIIDFAEGMVTVAVIESLDADYQEDETYSLTIENAISLKREYES
jgi:hypothetical protein